MTNFTADNQPKEVPTPDIAEQLRRDLALAVNAVQQIADSQRAALDALVRGLQDEPTREEVRHTDEHDA